MTTLNALTQLRAATQTFKANTYVLIGGSILALITLAGLLAPWLAPYPEDALGNVNTAQTLLPPSAEHWMGTDQAGRDVLSRVLFGTRTSLTIVVAVIAVAGTIGTILGVVAGFAGGVIRDIVMRVTDMFLAFPALLLALALALILRPSMPTVILAIAVTWWPWYTRLTASVASSMRNRGYVEAARCLGVSAPRLVLRHVLPNSMTPVLVQSSLDAGGILITSAALSYLGLGANGPTPEWGLMVSEGQQFFTTAWWAALFPGLTIMITALAFNLLGEGLRSSLDPRRTAR
ncbi:ABC transporter permease [Arthrobacter sp. R4]|uniref:ABC transporter permease n=1 Tax=Arthrobacter sp. R4 TaxID=644417 RepID=UPI003ED92BC9